MVNMKPHPEPLYKRLHLENKWWNYEQMEPSIELATRLPPTADDYDRGLSKGRLPFNRFLVSLACYYAGELELTRSHAEKCIEESAEFFFGPWRTQYKTEDNIVDPSWWKRNLQWMRVFECALLWGSVLWKWEFLRNIGTFPERDSIIALDYTEQDRDLFMAIGRLLYGASEQELEECLELAEAGPRENCKLLVDVMRSILLRDVGRLQAKLIRFLEYYKAETFPKEEFTAKISIHGTLFVHWAEKQRLGIKVPLEFEDYIVRLPKLSFTRQP